MQCGTSMVMLLLNLTVSFDAIAVITCGSYLVMLVAFHFIRFPAADGPHKHTRIVPEEACEVPEVPEEAASEPHPDAARLSAGA